MSVNLIQYRGTVGILISQHFVFDLKHKIQSLLIHSHSNVFSQYACFFRNSILLFLFLAVFLILKVNSCKRSNNSRVSPFLIVIIKTWLATCFTAFFYYLVEMLNLTRDQSATIAALFPFFHGMYICSQLC